MNNQLKAYRVGHDGHWPDWLLELLSESKVIYNAYNMTFSVATSNHGTQIAYKDDYIKVYPNGSLVVDRLPKVWVHQDCMCTHSKTKAGD